MNDISIDSLPNDKMQDKDSSMHNNTEYSYKDGDGAESTNFNDDSIFQMPDLILKIGPRKLFVKKDDFKQISKVFEAMLINDFKEKNRSEIEFKDKDYKTFVHFLRVSHPGLTDPFEDEWVHDVLPLIDEYLAEDTRHEADVYLAKTTKENEQRVSSSNLIEDFIEAEKYNLPKYLNVCIDMASKRLTRDLLSDDTFNFISLETRYKICLEKCKAADKSTNQSRYNKTPSPRFKY